MQLVERVLGALLELLLADLDALLLAQARVLLLDLGQPAGLERRVRRLVPSLRVAVHFCRVGACREGERVQGVFDARGVQRRGLLVVATGITVQLRQVQRAARLLLCRLCACAFGFGREGGFFRGEEGVSLGLLAGGFSLLCCFCFSKRELVKKKKHSQI